MGPSWMPDSSRIIFVKNDRQEYNPYRRLSAPSGLDRLVGRSAPCGEEHSPGLVWAAKIDF
jgi:hypothetical protein